MNDPTNNPPILRFIRSAIGRDTSRATDAELLDLYLSNGDNNALS